MTTARDTYNQIEYAKEEGHAKGREEGEKKKAVSIARKMLAKGIDISTISEFTALSPQEIEDLKEPKASE